MRPVSGTSDNIVFLHTRRHFGGNLHSLGWSSSLTHSLHQGMASNQIKRFIPKFGPQCCSHNANRADRGDTQQSSHLLWCLIRPLSSPKSHRQGTQRLTLPPPCLHTWQHWHNTTVDTLALQYPRQRGSGQTGEVGWTAGTTWTGCHVSRGQNHSEEQTEEKMATVPPSLQLQWQQLTNSPGKNKSWWCSWGQATASSVTACTPSSTWRKGYLPMQHSPIDGTLHTAGLATPLPQSKGVNLAHRHSSAGEDHRPSGESSADSSLHQIESPESLSERTTTKKKKPILSTVTIYTSPYSNVLGEYTN